MNLINIIEIILIIALLVLLVILYINPKDTPPQWKLAVRNNQVSSELKRLHRFYPDKQRFYNFWFQIERIKEENITGDFAELGVYKGHSAKIIHHMAQERKLHLFDTFKGFTEKDIKNESGKAATYTTRNFADCSSKGVMEYIKGNENIIFHEGYFPDTTKGLEKTIFAFVNMDADMYNPTKAGLEFFYSHLSPGGVIIVHDYNHQWPGLMKAVDDFSKTIPEVPVQIPDKNSSVMIIRQ